MYNDVPVFNIFNTVTSAMHIQKRGNWAQYVACIGYKGDNINGDISLAAKALRTFEL